MVSEIGLRKRSATYLSICNLCRKRKIKQKGDRREDDQWEVKGGRGCIRVRNDQRS